MNTQIARDKIAIKVPTDISGAEADIAKSLERRKELGGTTPEQRAADFGSADVDLWDGSISETDLKAVAADVEKNPEEPSQTVVKIARQGAQEPGAALLYREDKWTDFLAGRVASMVVLKGTATDGPDGKKVAGPGAILSAQFEYEVSAKELADWTEKAAEMGKNVVVVADKDEYGQALRPKIRLNVDALLTEEGIVQISPTLRVENIPAVNLLELVEDAGKDTFEVAWKPLLSMLGQKGLAANFQFVGEDGASVGIKTNLQRLHELGNEPFVPNDSIPGLSVSGNIDAKVSEDEGTKFVDVGTFDVALGRLNIKRTGEGTLKIQYEDVEGKFQDLDLSKVIPGAPFEGDLPEALLAGLLAMYGA